MKNKKILGIALTIVIVLLTGSIVFYIGSGIAKNTRETDITRYEWIEMLCTQTGMDQGTMTDPAFDDVDSGNTYFPYVQAAANWRVLNEDPQFMGDIRANGEFIALTAMKAVGESKIQIYLDTDNEITDEEYLQLAQDLDLINKKDLAKGFTEDEAQQVIEKYQELYYGELWPGDFEEVKYQEKVTELTTGDILWGDEDGTELIVTSPVSGNLSIGDIVVFDSGKEGKIARRVENIGNDDRISLSNDVELGEIFESYRMYATEKLDFEDIVSYYDLTPKEAKTAEYVMPVGSAATNVKGFDLSVETEENDNGENELYVQITGGGVTYELPGRIVVEQDTDLDIEVNVEDITVKASADMRGVSLQEAEVHVDAVLDTDASVSMEAEHSFKLLEIPVTFLGGAVTVDVEFYLVVGMDGKVSLQAEIPVSGGMRYEKRSGICRNQPTVRVQNPTLEAECTVEFAGCVEPILRVMAIDVVDVELECGVQMQYKVTKHPQMTCSEKTLSFPVFTIAVSGDDSLDTIVGEGFGLSAEWEVISADNAPVHRKQHWEEIPPAGKEPVDKCTYEASLTNAQKKEKEKIQGTGSQTQQNTGNQNANINMNPNTDRRLSGLFGKDIPAYVFVEEIQNNGDEYKIIGNVYVRDYIKVSDYDTLRTGSTVTSLQGDTYVVKSTGDMLLDYPVIELEKNGKKWYCCKAKNYQYFEFSSTPGGQITYLPVSTEAEFAEYSMYVNACEQVAQYEAQGLDIPDAILNITEGGPYWGQDDTYTIKNVEFTVDKDTPVYDAIAGFSYSREEIEDIIQNQPYMHMYDEGMTFGEAYAENEIQKATYYSDRFYIMGFYLTQQGDLDLLFSLTFPD